MTNEIKVSIENFLSELTTKSDIDIIGIVDIDSIDVNNAYDSIYDMINDNNGFHKDIIYYSNAIEYLSDNDNSLTESLQLADEHGYELKNLNSEILASLLASKNCRENFDNFRNEIENFFKELIDTDNI